MDEYQTQLTRYIVGQIQAGQASDVIFHQLVQAGWPEEVVTQAFHQAHRQLMPPAHPPQPHQPGPADATSLTNRQHNQPAQQPISQHMAGYNQPPQANGKRRGAFKIAWALLKQSFAVLRGNRYLLRYFVMTWAISLAIYAVIFAVGWSIDEDLLNNNLFWYGYAFLAYLVLMTTTNFYAAALSANLFDIFRGIRRPYAEYVAQARGKFGPIFVYSVISAIIGTILEYVIERFRFLGYLFAWLIGAVWSVSTLFVLPIIMDSPSSAPQAIKQSFGLLKHTWGPSIIAKIGVNLPLALLQIALLSGAVFVIVSLLLGGVLWPFILVVCIAYLLVSISLAVIGSFANSLINVALYYYAVNGQAPPSFDAELLNKVLIPRKQK